MEEGITRYSTSKSNQDIVNCFLVFQDLIELLKNMQKSRIDFLKSEQANQLVSVKTLS